MVRGFNSIVYLLLVLFTVIGCNKDEGNHLWKDGIISYQFMDEGLNKKAIRDAMFIWAESSSSSVSFVEYTEGLPSNGVKIYKSKCKDSASFSIGDDGDNALYIGQIDLITLLHELGHVIGLVHEHQRPDRDIYITILWDNIIESHKNQFIIRNEFLYSYDSYPYDYSSVMHYEKDIFSLNGRDTIISKDSNRSIDIKGLSVIDIQKVYDMYNNM